jgi:ferredoxin--NADP+ reductase
MYKDVFTIREKESLAHNVHRIVVDAPYIAGKTLPGQFVMLRVTDHGERIPMTIADSDREKGTITIIYQEVGRTTMMMASLSAGDRLEDVVGPLGLPSQVQKLDHVVCVGGGIGIAPIHPVARGFKEAGSRVLSILGARSRELLILEEEMKIASSEVRVCTDDGSYGKKGSVTNILEDLIQEGRPIDLVMAVGPVPMMEAVCRITRPYTIKTVVSLNPIMVDGTGMCGACRVTVDGETKFACVDGPEFDGHLVDFTELKIRQKMYLVEEHESVETSTYLGN